MLEQNAPTPALCADVYGLEPGYGAVGRERPREVALRVAGVTDLCATRGESGPRRAVQKTARPGVALPDAERRAVKPGDAVDLGQKTERFGAFGARLTARRPSRIASRKSGWSG